jgi:hypothetical protein
MELAILKHSQSPLSKLNRSLKDIARLMKQRKLPKLQLRPLAVNKLLLKKKKSLLRQKALRSLKVGKLPAIA